MTVPAVMNTSDLPQEEPLAFSEGSCPPQVVTLPSLCSLGWASQPRAHQGVGLLHLVTGELWQTSATSW